MDAIYRDFIEGFQQALESRTGSEHRVGAELKFPLVNPDGSAASFETICSLWGYLQKHGWQPVKDLITGNIVGAKKPGEHNETVATCETGFCKPEFSLAHVANLFDLENSISELRKELHQFSEDHQAFFLGYGIQPLTPPSRRLLMKKARTSVWERIFASNRLLPLEDGDDVNIFTITAASHVHVSVSLEEAIPAVNLLNGFAGAQIALTANSNIWQLRIDPQFKCVAEKLWDWWMPDTGRVGMPQRSFRELEDYIHTVSSFRPVYVKRDGKPILLSRYRTFKEYYCSPQAIGFDMDGKEIPLAPEKEDVALHNTFYWYNARISRYYTVENRVNDQQPPQELICVAALTLGLISALSEGLEELSTYDWESLRATRETACRQAMSGNVDNISLALLAEKMIDLAQLGLCRRGLGEEEFLRPLKRRLRQRKCPADEAAQLFESGGIEALLKARKL